MTTSADFENPGTNVPTVMIYNTTMLRDFVNQTVNNYWNI